jgi:hypothetical protein
MNNLRMMLLETIEYIKNERIAAREAPEKVIPGLIKATYLDAGTEINEDIHNVLQSIAAHCIPTAERENDYRLSDPVQNCDLQLRHSLSAYI